jgi:hypothetical protein
VKEDPPPVLAIVIEFAPGVSVMLEPAVRVKFPANGAIEFIVLMPEDANPGTMVVEISGFQTSVPEKNKGSPICSVGPDEEALAK